MKGGDTGKTEDESREITAETQKAGQSEIKHEVSEYRKNELKKKPLSEQETQLEHIVMLGAIL